MVSLHPLPADAAALHALRRGHPLALPCPRELTRSLRTHLPPHPGYAFSWGQLIEWPGELPDPNCEDYTGVRWSIIPVSVWHAVLPRLRARGGHLYRLLEHAWLDGTYCVEAPLPDYVYLDTPLRVAVAGFITLSAADACRARGWFADSFLVDDLPEVLAHYQENLRWWIDNSRPPRKDPQAREGDRAWLSPQFVSPPPSRSA